MNTSPQPPDDRDSREIQNDIRSTRNDMDRTLDSLNDRLSPRSLINSVMDWFESKPSGQQGVVAEKSGDMLQLIKENPMPALLTGAGIAWLIAESRSSGSHASSQGVRRYRPADEFSHNLRQSYGAGGIHTEAIRTSDHDMDDSEGPGALERSKSKLSDISGKVGDAMSRAKDGAASYGSEGAESVKGAFASASQSGSEMSSRLADGVQEKYHVVDRNFRRAVDEVPLGVGLGFLGLGVLAGLLLPRTDAEDELMGDAADDLKEAASDKGGDLLERGRQVASRVADKALEEADNQGLTPDKASGAAGKLSDKVGSVVQAAKEEGKAAAKDEGLTAEELEDEAKEEGDKLSEEATKRLAD